MADFLLRNAFTVETITYIGRQIASAWPQFPEDSFIEQAHADFESLSFGDRSKKITSALESFLPGDFPQAADILIRSLGPEPKTEKLVGFEGFYIMPLTGFVAKKGLDHPGISLGALYEMTKRFSAELDIRPFIAKYPRRTLDFLGSLIEDQSPFARRLASEGTRPRLPLCTRISEFQIDPTPVIKILDRLYTDENLMVRRSVANSLNDISKDNPDVAVDTLARWKGENPSRNLDWIVRHGMRTLVRKSHPGAFSLLGYYGEEFIIEDFALDRERLTLGDSLKFSWRIVSESTESQNLALNYIIYFKKANGDALPKVFRLPSKILAANKVLSLKKIHKFLPFKNQSFYPGYHYVELQINGKKSERRQLYLDIPERKNLL